ncbi:MAG: hypothetical protein HRU03_04910 [Nanoarchaeales archaeon]|nr:hypothetical protein [Nanoarchaeales archaeon]
MVKWSEVYEVVLKKTKETNEKNKDFIFKMSLLIVAIGVFTTVTDIYSPTSEWTAHIGVEILNIFIYVTVAILALVNVIYLYYKNKSSDNKTYSEAESLLFGKILPIIITSILFTILIIPLFLLLIVPGIIFSILWSFYLYAILFRDKKYYSALKYSASIVSGKKLLVLNNFIAYTFNQYRLWLLPILAALFVVIISQDNITLIILFTAVSICLEIYTLRTVVFSINLFETLEELKFGKKSDTHTSESSHNDKLSLHEKNCEKYIRTHKKEYSKASIKTALINSGNSELEVKKYIKKYY